MSAFRNLARGFHLSRWGLWAQVNGRVGQDKQSHILVYQPPNTQFFHYFGLLSKFCWRRTTSIPEVHRHHRF
jgi:hypothetical protein